MAGRLRLSHREAHVGEEAALPPFADVVLRLGVRGGGRGSNHIEPELGAQLLQLSRGHMC